MASLSTLLIVLVVLAVFAVPCVLGYYLSRLWRMPDYFGRIWLVLFTTLAGIVICVFGWPPKLGIDLSGGVILVYEIPEAAAEKESADAGPDMAAPAKKRGTESGQQAVDMDKLIGAVSRRINPGGVKEITVRPYGSRQIEIIVPEADVAEAERLKRIISRIGSLEFRILATTHRQQYRSYIERARTMDPSQVELYDDEGNRLAWWVPVAKGKEKSFDHPDIATRKVTRGDQEIMEVLVVQDRWNVNGGYLTRARAGESMGQPVVLFHFNSRGAQLFGRLTGYHLPDEVQNIRYYLGILLDGYLHSAPYIKSAIFESGEISGDFTQQQVQELVDVLNAGSLPTALSTEPISESIIGPTLGSDTIAKGVNASLVGSVMVCAFMLLYYRFAGLVANLALTLNILLLIAAMILIKAAFTLSGLAGIALTVGMAVDANVLIYERMREEIDKQSSLRMAIRNGFDRALSAIIDSNITTLISAAVLYVVGSDQVRGFATTLFIGITINLFTAVVCSHVLFDIAERQKWLSRLKMMRMMTRTNIDFWGFRYRAYAISLVVITIGVIGVFARGVGLLDIDFTGGVSVQVAFDEPQRVDFVRESLRDLQDLIVNDVQTAASDERPGFRRRYVINTSTPEGKEATDYLREVEDKFRQSFGDKLFVNTVTVAEVTGAGSGSKPAAPPPKAESPVPKAQSRSDLPSAALLASADPAAVLLAQAEPAVKTDAPSTPAPTSAEKAPASAEKAPAKTAPSPPAKAAPPTGSKPAPAAPSAPAPEASKPAPAASGVKEEAKGAAPKPEPGTPKAEPAAPKAEKPPADAPATPAAKPERVAGGTQALLKFREPVRYEAVEAMLQTEVEALRMTARAADLRISHPKYVPGQKVAFDQWTVRVNLPEEKGKALFDGVAKRANQTPFFPSSNTIGGKVAGSTRQQALYAIIVSNILIMLYLWVRFQRVGFGVAAVVALVHDVLVALGLVALSKWLAPFLGVLMIDQFKIGLTEVAAFLTIVGFSVNDTVVIFDRMREIKGKSPALTPDMINLSINQTLSRTILTSTTALMVVLVLYILGGPTIHGFAFTMFVGMISGVYSTVYVASPLLLLGKSPPPPKA